MLIDLLAGLTATETTRSKGRTPSHLEGLDSRPCPEVVAL